MGRQYGQDSEKGQFARAVKLREMEEESQKKQKIERYVSIAFLVLGVVVLIGCIMSARNFKSMTVAALNDLNAEQENLSELKDINDTPELTTEYIDIVSSSASDAGLAVSQIQNDLNTAIAAEAIANTSAGELSEDHMVALERLRALFDETNSRAVRNTWCTFGDWEFNGVYQFEGNYMTVVWKCYARDDTTKDRLLAFVKARYDADKHVFNKGELYYTVWYQSFMNDNNMLVEGDQSRTDTGDGVDTSDVIDYSKYSRILDNTSSYENPEDVYEDTEGVVDENQEVVEEPVQE